MSMRGALVVGGTGGLGRAACMTLAREWAGVAIGYRSKPEAAATIAAAIAPPCVARPVRCDLADRASIDAAVAQARAWFDGLDTVVFASGVQIAQPFVSKIGEDEWREVIETELLGLTRVVSAVLPVFREQRGGNFVIVTSFANYWFPPGDALSSVPKAGMEALGRAIAKEEGKFGIRANMVAPGIIDAGLGHQFLETMYSAEIWEAQRKGVALRRFGAAEEVAEAIAFLASDRARYVTGQAIIVDGGLSL